MDNTKQLKRYIQSGRLYWDLDNGYLYDYYYHADIIHKKFGGKQITQSNGYITKNLYNLLWFGYYDDMMIIRDWGIQLGKTMKIFIVGPESINHIPTFPIQLFIYNGYDYCLIFNFIPKRINDFWYLNISDIEEILEIEEKLGYYIFLFLKKIYHTEYIGMIDNIKLEVVTGMKEIPTV